MKNEKGITLISLTIYCIGMVITIALIATVTTNVNGNISELKENLSYLQEINKLSMYMIEETKNEQNSIHKLAGDGSYIEFKNGNVYLFADNSIYRNEVKICKNIKSCFFSSNVQNEKDIVKVVISAGDKKILTKTMEYVFN